MALRTRRAPGSYEARLRALRQQFARWHRLILASNRGPVQFHVHPNGELTATRGTGGLVTALSGLGQHLSLTWVACATSAGEREAVRMWGERFRAPLTQQDVYLRYLSPSRDVYHRYYNVISNPLLWFLQHYMWDPSSTPNIDTTIYDAWANGYVPVNQAFAEAVAEEASRVEGQRPVIMFQDYHLYLAPAFLREFYPYALQLHFVHIPWPSPRYWMLLPRTMRREICDGLCANDIVGFQTSLDVRNFLLCCQTFLPGSVVDYNRSTVTWRGRTTQVKAYPISIDVVELQRFVSTPEVQQYQERLRSFCGAWTIVRVDRMEPSKNIIRGFRAYELLLERYPHLQGQVRFLAFLVPSRTNIRLYQRYTFEVRALVDAINRRFGTPEWTPIEVFYEENYPQAIAALTLYDVLLVNAVADGMNLVAKEGPTVNARDGVLVLSETAGAHGQLGEYALTVSAADIEGTCNALYTALTMAPEERQRRAAALREAIMREDITLWLWWQVQDLKQLERRNKHTPTALTP